MSEEVSTEQEMSLWGGGVDNLPGAHTHVHTDARACWQSTLHPVALSPQSLSPTECVGGLMGESHLFPSALITSQAHMKDCKAHNAAGR